DDLLITNQLLYQLSYASIYSKNQCSFEKHRNPDVSRKGIVTELTNIYFFTRKSTRYALKNTNLGLVFYGDF
ncbi:MAG: hypothetical protein ACOYNS_07080, partial [Bacteroidota bacterium]